MFFITVIISPVLEIHWLVRTCFPLAQTFHNSFPSFSGGGSGSSSSSSGGGGRSSSSTSVEACRPTQYIRSFRDDFNRPND